MPIHRAKFHFDNTYSGMDMRYGPYILYQVGDLHCEPGYQTYEHVQAVYEIIYVLSGSGSVFVNDQIHEVQKADLLIVRKGDKHNIVSSGSDPLRFYYLGFDFQDPIQSEKIAYLKHFFDQTKQIRIRNTAGIQDAFTKILSEFLSHDTLSALMIEAYIQEIVCSVYRVATQHFSRSYLLSSNNTDEKLVYDVIHYMDVNLETLENLRDLSREFGYSYTHIAQKFSSFTGESLKAYHTKRRFEKANDYLRQGYSVTKVAERMGFKSIHAFSRAYKKHVGYTPREYKKLAEDERGTLPQSE